MTGMLLDVSATSWQFGVVVARILNLARYLVALYWIRKVVKQECCGVEVPSLALPWSHFNFYSSVFISSVFTSSVLISSVLISSVFMSSVFMSSVFMEILPIDASPFSSIPS